MSIKACRLTDNEIVGHLPREIARPTKYLLDRGAVVCAILSSEHYRRSPLFQGGLEIQCIIKVSMPGTVKGHLLIDRYGEMVDSLYCEPTDEIVMGSYLEKGIQLQPQPKKRKIDKKNSTKDLKEWRHSYNICKYYKS